MSRNFAELDDAVRRLVERHREAITERDDAVRSLSERETQVRDLQAELLDLKSQRGDVTRRIDAVIAEIDELDTRLDLDSQLEATGA